MLKAAFHLLMLFTSAGMGTSQFADSNDDVCNERDAKEDQEHPSDPLQGFDDRSVKLQHPTVVGQLNDALLLVSAPRGDVLLQLVDANAG